MKKLLSVLLDIDKDKIADTNEFIYSTSVSD